MGTGGHFLNDPLGPSLRPSGVNCAQQFHSIPQFFFPSSFLASIIMFLGIAMDG